MARSSMVATGLSAADELVIVRHEPGRYVLGTHRNVLLGYWLSDVRVEAVQMLLEACQGLSALKLGGFSALHYVKQSVSLPGNDVRKAMADSMQRVGSDLRCLGVVLEGAGFWASAASSFITGIRMLSPQFSMRVRVMSDLNEVKGWFATEHQQRTQERVDDQRLLALLSQVRAVGDSASASSAAAAKGA